MKRSPTGSILILALWVLFFLASLTVAAAGHVWAVLQAAERLQDRVLGHMQASSAAAWAVAVIEEHTREAANGTNGWDGVAANAWNRDTQAFSMPAPSRGDPVPQGRVYFSHPDAEEVLGGVVGEEGRLHLNLGSRDRLHALFAYVGGDQGARLANRLFGSTDGSYGGLTGGHEDAYDRAVFQAVEDLLLADGIDEALFADLEPHLTVFGVGNLLNVNSASRAVLVAFLMSTDEVEGVSNAEAIADEILAARQQRGFRDSADFRARLPGLPSGLLGRGLTFSSTAFRGVAVGAGMEHAQTGLEIAFVWDTIMRQYVVWRER